MAYENLDVINQLPPELQDEILARERAGRGSFVMKGRDVAVAPQDPGPMPIPAPQPAGAFDILRGQWADEARHLQQRYQDEVELAEQWKRQNNQMPPITATSMKPLRPSAVKSGDDIFQFDPNTGGLKPLHLADRKLEPPTPEKLSDYDKLRLGSAFDRLNSAQKQFDIATGKFNQTPENKLAVQARIDAMSELDAARREINKMSPPKRGVAVGGVDGLRKEAQQAIADRKDPVAVRARFKELTGEEL